MRIALLVALFAAACASNPAAPSVPLNQQFTLELRETASIDDTPLRVTFLRVSGDSRCPADAICIQGGDATVHVRIEQGLSTSSHELHTGDAARATTVVSGYRVTLTNLQPYPFSSKALDPDDYRATFVVAR